MAALTAATAKQQQQQQSATQADSTAGATASAAVDEHRLHLLGAVAHLWDFYLSPAAHFALRELPQLAPGPATTLAMLSLPQLQLDTLSVEGAVGLGRAACTVQSALSAHVACHLLPEFHSSLLGERLSAELLSRGGADR